MAEPRSPYQIPRSPPSGETVFLLLLSGIFFLLILSPLLGIGMDLLQALGRGTLDFSTPFMLSDRRLGLLVASIGLASAVAASSILVGTLLVSILWKTSRVSLIAVLLGLLALAAIPPYIHALVWSALMGYLADFFPGMPVSGWGISYWVECMALLPVAALLVWIAFASVDPALVEAGRVFRPDIGVFAHILIPLAAPALGASFGLLFLLCCSDYAIPSLFGADVYALDIFAQFSMSASPAQAFLYAIPLMSVTMIVLFLCRSGIRTLAQTPDWLSARFATAPCFPGPLVALQYLACGLIATQICVLFFGLVLTTGSYTMFINSVLMARGELIYSLMIAGGVILVSLPLALVAAYELKKPGARGTAAWILVLLPLAVPASLTGIGLATFWHSPVPALVCPGILLPVMVGIARFAPLAAIILFVQIRFIDPLMFDAADVFSPDPLMRWGGIRLPLFAPGLAVATGILAALTLAELGATLVVAPPGYATLTMRIYNYLHYGAAGEVAGLCLMITILTLIAGAITVSALYWLYRKPQDMTGHGGY
jgi:iron(III) transport system permease protein